MQSGRRFTQSQSNDWYRGPTELVQHFAYRQSSHRRQGATSHKINMVWIHPGGEKGGILLIQLISMCLHAALRRRGGGEGVSTLWGFMWTENLAINPGIETEIDVWKRNTDISPCLLSPFLRWDRRTSRLYFSDSLPQLDLQIDVL